MSRFGIIALRSFTRSFCRGLGYGGALLVCVLLWRWFA